MLHKATTGEVDRLLSTPVDEGVVTAGLVTVELLPEVAGEGEPLVDGAAVDPDPTTFTESFIPIPQCPTTAQMK